MSDPLKPTWNQLYDRVPYSIIKFVYQNEFILNVRILNPKCVDITNFDQHMRELNSTINDRSQMIFTMKYLMGDLIEMISSSPDTFYQQINAVFEAERNIHKQGNLTLTQIDTDILWLLLQNRCNKMAIKRYEISYEAYNSHNETQLGFRIQALSMEIVASINNAIEFMNILLQKIHSHRDHLIQTKTEEIWSDESRKRFAEIQVWFDEIATIIDDTLQGIETMQKYDQLCCIDEMIQANDTLERLIKLILVVEIEPKEILKTETLFSCTIRMLLTANNLKLKMKDLNVSILFREGNVAGKVLMRSFKFQQEHDLYFHLKSLKWDKVKRKKSEHSFIENKYVLKFDLEIKADEKEFEVSTYSRSFFVIVHHTQEALAKAAFMWDKHLTDVPRTSEASVPWPEMRKVLRSFFKYVTGFELNDGHLAALYDKASRENIIEGDYFYWEVSCKSMKNVKFMFWEWYYSALKFIKDNISLWKEGLVEGFACDDFLKNDFPNYPAGRFLLRFSESKTGALILVLVECKEEKNEVMEADLDSSDMFMRKNRTSIDSKVPVIVDIIRDIYQCTHLCDGTPKDQALKKFPKSTSDEITSKYKLIKRIFAVNTNNSTCSTNVENSAIAVTNSPDLNSSMQSDIVGFNSPYSDMFMQGRFTNESPDLSEFYFDAPFVTDD